MSNADHPRPATDPPVLPRDEIELRMRAIRDHVPGLRALAAERAMRADHDLDFIDDFRLAVDEVCAIVLANCTSADTLTVRLIVNPNHVAIDASAPLTVPRAVSGLSLRVLEALADSLDHWVDDEGAEQVFRVSFGRSRRPSALG